MPNIKRRKGFSLVEMLIVILLIGILSALLVMSLRTPHEDAEAQKIAHHLKALKSAYMAYYADTHKYLPAVSSAGPNSALMASLDRYAIKSIDSSLGPIMIRETAANGVYIGFVGGSTLGNFNTSTLYRILRERADYYGIKGADGGVVTANGPLLLRVK